MALPHAALGSRIPEQRVAGFRRSWKLGFRNTVMKQKADFRSPPTGFGPRGRVWKPGSRGGLTLSGPFDGLRKVTGSFPKTSGRQTH